MLKYQLSNLPGAFCRIYSLHNSLCSSQIQQKSLGNLSKINGISAISSSLNKMDNTPLVSMYVISYNQEKWVAEALRAALSQDYENLQLIFSDDYSTDRTWEIMQQVAAEYKGPHRIVLNRNPRNLGIGGHINKVVELCDSEIIVASAADDISYPERVSTQVKTFMDNPSASLVWSAFDLIDEEGKPLDSKWHQLKIQPGLNSVSRNEYWITGCGMAFKKSIFQAFGPMDPRCFYEDVIIAFRAILTGDIIRIDKPLLAYRSSAASITNHHALGKYHPEALEKQCRVLTNDFISRIACIVDSYVYERKHPEMAWQLERARRNIFGVLAKNYLKYAILAYPEKIAAKMYRHFFLFQVKYKTYCHAVKKKKKFLSGNNQ